MALKRLGEVSDWDKRQNRMRGKSEPRATAKQPKPHKGQSIRCRITKTRFPNAWFLPNPHLSCLTAYDLVLFERLYFQAFRRSGFQPDKVWAQVFHVSVHDLEGALCGAMSNRQIYLSLNQLCEHGFLRRMKAKAGKVRGYRLGSAAKVAAEYVECPNDG